MLLIYIVYVENSKINYSFCIFWEIVSFNVTDDLCVRYKLNKIMALNFIREICKFLTYCNISRISFYTMFCRILHCFMMIEIYLLDNISIFAL